MLTRRDALRSGIAAAVIVAGAGLVYEFLPDPPLADRYAFRLLRDRDRAIVAAIAPVMLAGALPEHEERAAVAAVVRGLDTAVAGLPPSLQAEVAQLFLLLGFPLARLVATGIVQPWHSVPPEAIDRFLNAWRYSPIAELRSAYDALHQLILAAWYGNEAAWSRIGYPGPPQLR